ncbi:hypothetical protein QUA13_25510 [Microcoleus sp. S28C3]|uniref:hypothetical protein n=1 Tax=Microcoleus sp. S28C3 TaxID=3055414 RepID=UPI002FD402C1
MLELTETLKACLWQTAKTLKGTQRRRFMAQIVQELGTGGQRQAQTELGWCRDTIRKRQRELETGLSCIDAFKARGRKPVESKLPTLSEDIKAIVDSLASDRPQLQKQALLNYGMMN